jgi:hypothetical protein
MLRRLYEPSKWDLFRHAQMMANATRVAFAERSLLQDHNRFLSKINGEVKVRCSTKVLVLGTAKVMSYKELDESRAKRAAKEATKKESASANAGILR